MEKKNLNFRELTDEELDLAFGGNIVEDLRQQACPCGGEHELVLNLSNGVISCSKCGQSWQG